ncbi:MAG: hypothetical protein H0U80_03140 [Solirubrobacterales bacterium]|nr:hypothetical protein [Solirubrobacterales bacterium]
MRSLAAEGKTVLVSSHLMSEMAQTADHLVVIGRGRLLADVSAREFLDGSRDGNGGSVLVRSPAGDALQRLLAERGHGVEATPDGAMRVRGAQPAEIGDLAAAHGLALHELRQEQASLEAAFMEMTRDSVEYSAESATTSTTVGSGG